MIAEENKSLTDQSKRQKKIGGKDSAATCNAALIEAVTIEHNRKIAALRRMKIKQFETILN